jgi:hypothetical protein
MPDGSSGRLLAVDPTLETQTPTPTGRRRYPVRPWAVLTPEQLAQARLGLVEARAAFWGKRKAAEGDRRALTPEQIRDARAAEYGP